MPTQQQQRQNEMPTIGAPKVAISASNKDATKIHTQSYSVKIKCQQ
jgi:hypothetical protein